MTATAMPQDLRAHSSNGLLRMAAIVAVLIVLTVASFAFGRGTADTSSNRPGITSTKVTPSASPNGCAHIAHMPPVC